MTSPALLNDTDLVEFAAPDDLRPYIDAAADLARAPVALRADAVQALGLAEVLPELDPVAARTLLFHAARVLAHTDPAAAWAGLYEAPAVLLGGASAPVALPARPPGHWRAALAQPGAAGRVLQVDPASRRWRPCIAETGSDGTAAAELSGLAGAYQQLMVDSRAPWSATSGAAWQEHADAQLALHAGLISGALQRQLDEAFGYARLRQSAGKPLLQHQAVAIRLADASMAHEALGLYLQDLACHGIAARAAPAGGYVTEAACGVARDALQTAAAHGYVEGLPFRKLHEATHALCALFGALVVPLCSPADMDLEPPCLPCFTI
jgi:hypothetical protein